MLDSLDLGVIAADDSGTVILANRAAKAFWNSGAGTLVGRPLAGLFVEPFVVSELEGWVPRKIREDDSDGELDVECLFREARAKDGSRLSIVSIRGLEPADRGRSGDLTRYLRATNRVASRLAMIRELESTLQAVVEALSADFDASLARIWLYEESTESLVLKASGGISTERDAIGEWVDPWNDPSLIAEVGRSRRVYLKNRLEDDPHFDQSWVIREGILSAAFFPLLIGGELKGLVGYFATRPLFGEQVEALGAFVAIVAASINNVMLLSRETAARQAAEADRKRLQTLLDAIPVGVVVAEGDDGVLTIANHAGLEISGRPVLATSIERYQALVPLRDQDGRILEAGERPLWRALRGGERVRETLRLWRDDGTETVLEVTAVPLAGPPRGAISIYHDVTERVRLDAELADRAAMLRSLLDHLPVGVIYFDAKGVCRASNEAARTILGLPKTRSGMVDLPSEILLAGAQAVDDALRACLEKRAPRLESSVAWVGEGEGQKFLDWRFEPLEPTAKAPIGALAIVVDVTEQTRAQAELQAAMKAAELASRNKTRFLSAVSHDLRTPVNAISLIAELFLHVVKDHADSDDLVSLTGDLGQAATALVELINDLLDLSRIDAGASEIRAETFRLDDWIEATVRPLERGAKAKRLEFSWRSDPNSPLIHGDRVKMGRVLTNLIGNALKFTEIGSVEVSAATSDQGWLVLSVIDTGPGIPEEQRERIFDEFSQLQNPERDRTKGTGLGLSISRHLVEAVGGRLTVEGRDGGGSIFRASYPPDHLPRTVTNLAMETEVRPISPAPRSGPILLVEDDATSRHALSMLLERTGFQVETAADGSVALEMIARSRPVLVLLDLMMPGMDGVDVLRGLGERPEGIGLPVVVLSGAIDSPDRVEELARFQLAGRLSKPIDVNALIELINRLVPTARVPG